MLLPAVLLALHTASAPFPSRRIEFAEPRRCEAGTAEQGDARGSERRDSRDGNRASVLAAPQAEADSALAAAYGRGKTWEQFLAEAQVMRELWQRNWERAVVPADVLASLTALPPGLRILVIAVDACSDSVNTIPYIAKLVSAVPGLELRVITRAEGRPFMESRRTPDGRSATPTVILLDAAGAEVGCWIERPSASDCAFMDFGTPMFRGGT